MRSWVKCHQDHLNLNESSLPFDLRRPKVYVDCDEVDLRVLDQLWRVVMPVGYPGERFSRDMRFAKKMTKGQRDYAYHLVYHFRRQLPKDLVALVERRIDSRPSTV